MSVRDESCWCGFHAQRWIDIRVKDTRKLWTRLPVCWAHVNPASLPVEVKLALAAEVDAAVIADGWPDWELSAPLCVTVSEGADGLTGRRDPDVVN